MTVGTCLCERGQTDGQTDRQTDRVIPIYPLKTTFCGGITTGSFQVMLMPLEKSYLDQNISNMLVDRAFIPIPSERTAQARPYDTIINTMALI